MLVGLATPSETRMELAQATAVVARALQAGLSHAKESIVHALPTVVLPCLLQALRTLAGPVSGSTRAGFSAFGSSSTAPEERASARKEADAAILAAF